MPDKDVSICCREKMSKILRGHLDQDSSTVPIPKGSLPWERKLPAGSSIGEVGEVF